MEHIEFKWRIDGYTHLPAPVIKNWLLLVFNPCLNIAIRLKEDTGFSEGLAGDPETVSFAGGTSIKIIHITTDTKLTKDTSSRVRLIFMISGGRKYRKLIKFFADEAPYY